MLYPPEGPKSKESGISTLIDEKPPSADRKKAAVTKDFEKLSSFYRQVGRFTKVPGSIESKRKTGLRKHTMKRSCASRQGKRRRRPYRSKSLRRGKATPDRAWPSCLWFLARSVVHRHRRIDRIKPDSCHLTFSCLNLARGPPLQSGHSLSSSTGANP